MKLCTSIYSGTNLLLQQINEMSRSKGGNNIPDNVIEWILLNDIKVVLDTSKERLNLIREGAIHFTNELLAQISQTEMDLKETRTIFIGGGSILLKPYIEMTNIVAKPLFIDNVRANVEGYRILYNNQKAGRI